MSDFHARSFTTAQGTRLSTSTTGFSRLLFNPAVPGFHQSTSHKFRLLITVFIVGVGLISRMTVLVLLKHDIIPQNQVLIDCCFIRPHDFHQTREGRTSQPAAVAFPSSLHEPSKGCHGTFTQLPFLFPPAQITNSSLQEAPLIKAGRTWKLLSGVWGYFPKEIGQSGITAESGGYLHP